MRNGLYQIWYPCLLIRCNFPRITIWYVWNNVVMKFQPYISHFNIMENMIRHIVLYYLVRLHSLKSLQLIWKFTWAVTVSHLINISEYRDSVSENDQQEACASYTLNRQQPFCMTIIQTANIFHIDGDPQDFSNYIGNILELSQSSTEPSINYRHRPMSLFL